MIRVVVFDFDGTLVDSNRVKVACMCKVVSALEGGAEALALARAKGGNRYKLFTEVARILGPHAAGADARAMISAYSDCCARGIVAARERRGARATLAALKRKGMRIWINSATPDRDLHALLRRRGIARFLDGARGGPATKTQILRAILAAERAHPREVVMVGDGPDDLAGARETGVWFVGIAAENRLPAGLRWAIPDLTRLVPLLDHMFSGRRPIVSALS